MSCYFRHMKETLSEAGIVVTPGNKKHIDRVIHETVGVKYKDCPTAWTMLKQAVISAEQKRRELTRKLRAAVR